VTAARARARVLGPLAILVCLAAFVPAVIAVGGIGRSAPQHHAKRSLDGRRQLNLVYERSYQYEATFEKCGIQGLADMASTLQVPATPTAVARAYARHHAPSIRRVVYNGCRDAYLDHWNPPPDSAP
jgi:hypothetical protein